MLAQLAKVATLIKQADHVAVLTGAGISAESGIPTFREAQTGLWAQYDPQQLATPEAFQRDPKLVWEWYQWRRDLVQQAAPNAGHHALAQLTQVVPKLTLITQNVDGLHEQAGSKGALELHGRIDRYKCFDQHHPALNQPNSETVPPTCPQCGSYLRPDVVWFGEGLPLETVNAAFDAAQSCDLFLSIGTSSLVHPAASLPLVALEQRIPVVEINPNRTPLSRYADFVLQGKAGEVLPVLITAVSS